jgi:hypothetical protein
VLSDLVRCVKEGIGGMKDDVIGYIEPGHGQKGKLRELTTDDDLQEMYILYKRKLEYWIHIIYRTRSNYPNSQK